MTSVKKQALPTTISFSSKLRFRVEYEIEYAISWLGAEDACICSAFSEPHSVPVVDNAALIRYQQRFV